METLTFRQPRIVALLILVLISVGLSSFLSLGRQEDPSIANTFASITTAFPGANPQRVEALVTAEIERELREIPEIKNILSRSRTGISVIQVELVHEVQDEEIEDVWSEVRNAIDDAALAFPEGVSDPEFQSVSDGAYSAIVALIPRHETVPLTIIGRYAEDLAERLRNLPDTKQVDLFGAPEEEVLVSIDPSAAAALGLTADQISRAIRAADSKVQSGRLRSETSDWLINIEGEFTMLDRLRRVTVRESDRGRVTRLSDIASVTRGARQPQAEIAFHDGRPAVLVAVRGQPGLQVDVWMNNLSQALDAYRPLLPVAIEQTVAFDQSRYTTKRLTEVGTSMAIGMVLVIAVLFVTLGARAAMVVAIVLPVVGLATIVTMRAIGLSLHQMSVSGLIVALGMLVDAAIVMTDEIGRHLRAGLARLSAVRIAVRRLFAPLLASTLTTALSFTPMILLPGPPGDFISTLAICVTTMLLWSFVVAMVVTPALAGWLLPDSDRTWLFSTGIRTGALGRLFERTIRLSLDNPVRSILLALVLPAIGFSSLPLLTAQFFPTVERDQFYIELETAGGSSIVETRKLALGVDAILRSEPGVASVYWVIGGSAPAFYYNIVSDIEGVPGYAQAMITAHSSEEAARLIPELRRRLDALYPQARILVRRLVQGPPVNAPVELRIIGPDLDILRDLGDRARQIVIDLDMVTTTRDSTGGGEPKVSLDIDETKVRLLGLNLTDVARQLESGLEGVTGGSLLEDTEQLPVRVRVGSATRGDMGAIANFPIVSPAGPQIAADGHYPGIALSSLARARLEPSEGTVVRHNGERMNAVQAFIVEGVLPEEALRAATRELDAQGFTLPPGYRMELGGDSEARSTTMDDLLRSAGIVVTLSIATIVLTFNSFRLALVVCCVAVLAVGLSLLALAAFQYAFGINAVIGVIGSVGVSINAAIIILTGLQIDRDATAGDRAAMTSVVMDASRHIVSTTTTTFFGFLPLILGGGGFWPPFAVAVAGGVLLSTVVSFFFTPPMFVLLYAGRREPLAAEGLAGRTDLRPAE